MATRIEGLKTYKKRKSNEKVNKRNSDSVSTTAKARGLYVQKIQSRSESVSGQSPTTSATQPKTRRRKITKQRNYGMTNLQEQLNIDHNDGFFKMEESKSGNKNEKKMKLLSKINEATKQVLTLKATTGFESTPSISEKTIQNSSKSDVASVKRDVLGKKILFSSKEMLYDADTSRQVQNKQNQEMIEKLKNAPSVCSFRAGQLEQTQVFGDPRLDPPESCVKENRVKFVISDEEGLLSPLVVPRKPPPKPIKPKPRKPKKENKKAKKILAINKALKDKLISNIKEQIAQDLPAYEEPKNFYQALKVMADDKCLKHKRKASDYKLPSNEGRNKYRSPSYHSIEVIGENFETPTNQSFNFMNNDLGLRSDFSERLDYADSKFTFYDF